MSKFLVQSHTVVILALVGVPTEGFDFRCLQSSANEKKPSRIQNCLQPLLGCSLPLSVVVGVLHVERKNRHGIHGSDWEEVPVCVVARCLSALVIEERGPSPVALRVVNSP